MTRENTHVEFKQSFRFGSMPEYARTMAAYASTGGGFIVFGVQDSPREVVGVNAERFDIIDPAKVTTFLNSQCSPELQWDIGTLVFAGVRLGFIYTHRHLRKPVIASTTCGKKLKEGDIYYRYRGQTTTIRFPELRGLIDGFLEQERRSWLQHLGTISRVGAMNVAVLNTFQGRLYGAGEPSFLIDEALLHQIKFIHEGQFTEVAGSPSLRLVGEVRTLSGFTAPHIVQRGIHYYNLMTVFLCGCPPSEDDAKSYLREASHQMSPYSPVFYFARQAHLTNEHAAGFIEDSCFGLRGTKANIVRRLKGGVHIKPLGTVEKLADLSTAPSAIKLDTRLDSTKSLKAKRSIFCLALTTVPEALRTVLAQLHIKPILEAVAHLDRPSCIAHSETLRQIIHSVFSSEFQKLDNLTQSTIRRAATYLDEQMNGQEGNKQQSTATLRCEALRLRHDIMFHRSSYAHP